MFSELPHGGKHLDVYKQAKKLLMRLEEERQVVNLLETAIAQRAKESLKSAVAAAHNMLPPFSHPRVLEATELIARIEKEEAVSHGLKKAMATRDKNALEDLLAEVGID
jgi:hypothetical protein